MASDEMPDTLAELLKNASRAPDLTPPIPVNSALLAAVARWEVAEALCSAFTYGTTLAILSMGPLLIFLAFQPQGWPVTWLESDVLALVCCGALIGGGVLMRRLRRRATQAVWAALEPQTGAVRRAFLVALCDTEGHAALLDQLAADPEIPALTLTTQVEALYGPNGDFTVLDR